MEKFCCEFVSVDCGNRNSHPQNMRIKMKGRHHPNVTMGRMASMSGRYNFGLSNWGTAVLPSDWAIKMTPNQAPATTNRTSLENGASVKNIADQIGAAIINPVQIVPVINKK